MPLQRPDLIQNFATGPAYVFYTPDLSTLQLPAPNQPVLTTPTTGGTVLAGTYQIAITYTNAFGETITSPIAVAVTTGSTSTISVASPVAALTGQPGVATGFNVYSSLVGGSTLTKQNATPVAIGTPYVISAPPTSSGAAPPVWNTSGALPQKLDDILTLTTPYTPKSPWLDGGALERSNVTIARTLAETQITTAHTNLPVASRVSSTGRTLTVPFQEISPQIMALAENAAAIESIAQGAPSSGTPAQTRVRVGAVSQLTRRRIAVVAERDPGVSGVTTENGARGQLFGAALFNVAIAAQDSPLNLHPDQSAARSVQFTAYAEPNAPDIRQAHGVELFETGLTVP